MERSRMDYYVDLIPAEALLQGDLETAERAVGLVNELIGRPAASGGGGIEDEAYATGDETIVQKVKELILNEQKLRKTMAK